VTSSNKPSKTAQTGEATNPWQTVSSRPIYQNPWIKIVEDQVINPAGGEGIYGKVHFQNQAVAVIPVDENHYTYLVGQHRYVLDQYSWEIPEGGAPHGEDPLDCAKRELQEETGLRAKNWQQLLHLHLSNSVTDEAGYVYLAQGLEQGEQDLEDTEDIQVRHLPLSEALAMCLDGRITDALTITSLMRLALMRPEWFDAVDTSITPEQPI